MKILHVVPSMEQNGGGPSESVPMTAMAQNAAGLNVAIAFYDVGELSLKAQEAEREGVRLIRFRGTGTKWNQIAFSWDFIRRFESVAKDYDIVHTHIQWMFPVWWAAHVARKLGKRLVMMPRGCFAPARLKESAWKKHIVGWIDRHYARLADAVWVTSQGEADGVRAFAPGSHVEVFPIGLDVEKYAISRQEGKTLLYFSRISPIKGLDMLAEAWGRVVRSGGVGGWRLVIVGPDDKGYTEEVKKMFAVKCASESYEFRPPAYGAEKFRLLSSADAFILPTYNENWGIAVAEAMASGLPVICTKGAPWQCLAETEAGWWTDISTGGIEAALRDLVTTSQEKRLEMGARGRKWAMENLDWKKIGTKMRQSYERRLPILMTASVDPRGMHGADFSPTERESMYVDALGFYLNEFSDDKHMVIVFAENSGWNLSSIKAQLGERAIGRVEFISLDPDCFDIGRGKGYNEFLLVSQAIRRSDAIQRAGAFLKVTGRYPIYNIKMFVRDAFRALNGRGCLFYGDIKDHGLYEILHLPWNGRIGSSVLFACTASAWREGVEPLIDRLDDRRGYWAEHLVYDYLMECRKNGRPVACRFRRELRCGGLKGSNGSGIAFSKDNSSFKERLNRMIGNGIRMIAPRFWF